MLHNHQTKLTLQLTDFIYFLYIIHKFNITIISTHLKNTGYYLKCVKITEHENGSNTDRYVLCTYNTDCHKRFGLTDEYKEKKVKR